MGLQAVHFADGPFLNGNNVRMISVVHRTWLVPKGYDDDPDYFSGQYMDDFLNIMGVHSANAIAGELEEEYFYDWQLGSQEEMTPGIVDVSVLRFFCSNNTSNASYVWSIKYKM